MSSEVQSFLVPFGEGLVLRPIEWKEAAEAVEKWHYSHKMPPSSYNVGVYEDNKFIGAITFGHGANNNIGKPYDLKHGQIFELTRVALTTHKAPVSQILMKAIKMVKKEFPEVKLLVSYADSNQKHLGIIYQATNWIYVLESTATEIVVNGKQWHTRSLYSQYGTSQLEYLRKNVDPNAYPVKCPVKYKYLMPLDKGLKKKLSKLALPYPKELKE